VNPLLELPLFPKPRPVVAVPACDSQGPSGSPQPATTGRGFEPLPRWLKRNVPKGNANHFTAGLLEELVLLSVFDNSYFQ
jgi:hypothetical protein